MRKYLIHTLTLSAVALLAISGCHPKEEDKTLNHDTLHIEYYYRYDAATDSTTVGANVWASYSATEIAYMGADLWMGEYLTFNGDTMRPRLWVTPFMYELELPGLVPAGTFTYHDYKRHQHTYSMPAVTPRTLPAGFTAINQHANDTLTWLGGPISTSEGISLIIESPGKIETIWNTQKPYIVLDSVTMLTFAPGTYYPYLQFISSLTSADGAPGGITIDRRLYSARKQVTVY